MVRLILSRLLGGVFVLAVVATVSFFLLRAAPGGPFDTERRVPEAVQRNIEERYHLNDPLWKQYTSHMANMLVLDFGHSMKRQRTVNEMIADHAPHSLRLGLMAIVFAAIFGTVLGVTAAARRNSWVDYALMVVALLGISVPSFVLGPIFIRFFALELGWFPPARAEDFAGYVLPALVLGMIYAGTVARLARAGVLDTLGQDYVRTARAKGLSEKVVVWKHALRLGVIPVITYLGPATAALISGSFVIEKIFQIPGLGFYFVDSVVSRDYPVLTGLLVFYVAFLVLLNLVVDILYGVIDPRTRGGG
ncbi:MAG: ABC transporter permease [Kofleriaceae bacterium]|nr:ABC transporter permease [Kofleriaceae bacterium]MCL4227645.1 ABC transporter permease [Myxococcales bacterium]